MSKFLMLLIFSSILGACATTTEVAKGAFATTEPAGSAKVMLASDVTWEQLNPARGDKSPRAATLWGDRKGPVATGFLLRPVDGFRSPPHVHNVSYRAVVIRGLLHNDDPKAADMWMPTGSFWTQPKGEVHITAAKGSDVLAYVEIESGPYLVYPTSKAFDSGERPVNVDASNVVWVDPPQGVGKAQGVKFAYLWGKPAGDQLHGVFIKLPKGFSGVIRSRGKTFGAVLIKGQLTYRGGKGASKTLTPGSFISARGSVAHGLGSSAGESVLYVRLAGSLDVSSS